MTKNIDKRTYLFETAPVPKAVLTLVVPTVISQILTIIYNFADTWFVGRTGDEAAVAAVSVAMPLFIVMTGLSNLFGIGGSSMISRSLGAKKEGDARSAFSFGEELRRRLSTRLSYTFSARISCMSSAVIKTARNISSNTFSGRL